jgi:hypothetical protein
MEARATSPDVFAVYRGVIRHRLEGSSAWWRVFIELFAVVTSMLLFLGPI